MTTKNSKFYLAAPFFNPTQVKMVERIEGMFNTQGMNLFSPRLQDNNLKKELDDKDAMQIFATNVANIQCCTHVLAVLDWADVAERELRIVQHTLINSCVATAKVETKIVSPPLNLTDTGTTFEMGMAFALAKPIYGFTLRKPGDKVNIMLTQCLRGVIYGFDRLLAFLGKNGVADFSQAELGVWRHR